MFQNNKIGRPTVLTPETKKLILTIIALGARRSTAAKCAGISYRTLQLWLKTGKDSVESESESEENASLAKFYLEVLQAEATAEAEAVRVIKESEDWKARAWWLERRHKEHWSKDKDKDKEKGDEKAVKVYLVDPNSETPFDPDAV
jgi:hypothetical protein